MSIEYVKHIESMCVIEEMAGGFVLCGLDVVDYVA